jgi:hypothetical protein
MKLPGLDAGVGKGISDADRQHLFEKAAPLVPPQREAIRPRS